MEKYLYKIRCRVCNIDYLDIGYPEDISAGQMRVSCPRCGHLHYISGEHVPIGRVLSLEEEDNLLGDTEDTSADDEYEDIEDFMERHPLSYEEVEAYLNIMKYEVQLSGKPKIISKQKIDKDLEIEVGDYIVSHTDFMFKVRGFGTDEINGEEYYLLRPMDDIKGKDYFCRRDEIKYVIKEN
jgi:phage FluMu protein Com